MFFCSNGLRNAFRSCLKFLVRKKPLANKKFKLKKASFGGEGLVDGVVEGDWNKIKSMVYGDRE